ncbi:MAG TPA: TonB-dependent receptor, partial [Anaeromyxobacteraceae bacterium]|nr:TonB-dependent receptor [Anaeromyxobacteraceae bacterium]
AGWQQGPLYVSANAFDVTVDRPIVFGLDASGLDTYVNGPRTGSVGVEGEVRLSGRHGLVAASWAHYSTGGRNQVPAYEVPGDRDRLLGFAGHTATARGQLRLPRRVALSSEVRWLSSRDAVSGLDAESNPIVGRIGARATVNLFASWQPAAVPGLELGAGVRDLFDAGTSYPQPYLSGAHAPLPGPSREFGLRVRYEQAFARAD